MDHLTAPPPLPTPHRRTDYMHSASPLPFQARTTEKYTSLFPFRLITAQAAPNGPAWLHQINVDIRIHAIDSDAVASGPAFILPHQHRCCDIWWSVDGVRSKIDRLTIHKQTDVESLDADKHPFLVV